MPSSKGNFDHTPYKWRAPLGLALSRHQLGLVFSLTAAGLAADRFPRSEVFKAMAKVHPSRGGSVEAPPVTIAVGGKRAAPAVLTVWRKSLLFNGNGFAVFDANGNLVFRVDNYASGSKAEVVLMDAAGKPLLTIRRKKLSLGDQWMIFEGEEAANPRFTVKRPVNPLHSRALAQVTPCTSGAKPCDSYKIEGSYSQRCCAILDDKRQQLVEIKRKEPARGIVFGLDVFRLIVQPGFDASFAMAIVMLLEQMFGSRASRMKIFNSFGC